MLLITVLYFHMMIEKVLLQSWPGLVSTSLFTSKASLRVCQERDYSSTSSGKIRLTIFLTKTELLVKRNRVSPNGQVRMMSPSSWGCPFRIEEGSEGRDQGGPHRGGGV